MPRLLGLESRGQLAVHLVHQPVGMQLFFAFYTFSNNVGSHCFGHCNDGANDGLRGAIRGYVVYKRSINLDALNGELLQK